MIRVTHGCVDIFIAKRTFLYSVSLHHLIYSVDRVLNLLSFCDSHLVFFLGWKGRRILVFLSLTLQLASTCLYICRKSMRISLIIGAYICAPDGYNVCLWLLAKLLVLLDFTFELGYMSSVQYTQECFLVQKIQRLWHHLCTRLLQWHLAIKCLISFYDRGRSFHKISMSMSSLQS